MNLCVVGIVSGGMAGLVCALNLEKHGVRSTVFDYGWLVCLSVLESSFILYNTNFDI